MIKMIMNRVFLLLSMVVLWVGPVKSQSFMEVVQDLTGLGEKTKSEVNENAVEDSISEDVASLEELIIDVNQLKPSENIPGEGVVLGGLDKETARVSSIEANVGEEIQFGTLKIKVHHCEMAPKDERPESIAFLSVVDTQNGKEDLPLFNGWMFSSSPALSALDHPVYDLWVKNCVVQKK